MSLHLDFLLYRTVRISGWVSQTNQLKSPQLAVEVLISLDVWMTVGHLFSTSAFSPHWRMTYLYSRGGRLLKNKMLFIMRSCNE